MNQYAMRRLDAWLGPPICWLLTRWRRLAEMILGTSQPTQPPNNVLFIKLAEMGAIVLAIPALEAARRRVGRDNLYGAMLAGNRDIHDLIHVFAPENLFTIRDSGLFAFAWDCLRMARRCRREEIEAVVDLEGFTRISAILSYLTGARIRVGVHPYGGDGPYRGDLFTHRVLYNPHQHTSEHFLALVEALTAPASELPMLKRSVHVADGRLPRIQRSNEDDREIERLLCGEDASLPARPWIVLNPNLVDLLPLRSWPREKFLELGQRLLDAAPQGTLVLVGLAEERELSRKLADQISATRCRSLAGKTSLRNLVALIDAADLLITSDSGPAHMASLTATPVVTLFGPETPKLYGPLGANKRALWAGLACSPCFSAANFRTSPCANNVCMREITVDQVFETATALCPGVFEMAPPQDAEGRAEAR